MVPSKSMLIVDLSLYFCFSAGLSSIGLSVLQNLHWGKGEKLLLTTKSGGCTLAQSIQKIQSEGDLMTTLELLKSAREILEHHYIPMVRYDGRGGYCAREAK